MPDNPYRSPTSDGRPEPSIDQSSLDRPFTFMPRKVLFIIASVAQLYFGGMVVVWTYDMSLLRDLQSGVMYIGAWVCTVGTAGALCGLIRNRQRFAYVFGRATLTSFAIMIFAELTR